MTPSGISDSSSVITRPNPPVVVVRVVWGGRN